MKQRKIAIALILLLCITALLSGTHLILHTGDHSHPATCLVCAMLARNTETYLCLVLAVAGIGLIGSSDKNDLNSEKENRLISDWTLVHRKIRMQN